MIKKVFIQERVPCPYYLENGAVAEDCQECSFFNGFETDLDNDITGVDCLRGEIPTFNCHVTSFTHKGYEYKARQYDEEKDGKVSETYCEKCCFNKILKNGNDVCLLRSGVKDNVECFICYAGEIWEKHKIE